MPRNLGRRVVEPDGHCDRENLSNSIRIFLRVSNTARHGSLTAYVPCEFKLRRWRRGRDNNKKIPRSKITKEKLR
jgi:hypothetical protein